MTSIRSIIIDDEADGRDALRIALEKYFPELRIEGSYASPEEALTAIREQNPDLVFLDIQMPQMSGFDLLRKIDPLTFEVIFVTAYDQYAIKAIRFSALDYLLKPVDLDDLRSAIEKAKARIQSKNSSHKYLEVLHNAQHKAGKVERVAVHTLDGIDFFNTDDIIYCKAEGSYTALCMRGKQSHLVSRNLKEFEDLLQHSGFCRVHHSYLVNLQHVHRYVKGEGGYVILTDSHHVDVSRRKKEEFVKLLERI